MKSLTRHGLIGALGLFLAANLAQAQNLLTNGGFEGSANGWLYSVGYSAMDALARPGSGSAVITNDFSGIAAVTGSQCVPVSAGRTYHAGGRIMVSTRQTVRGAASVRVIFFGSTNCTGASTGGSLQTALATTVGSWTPVSAEGTSPAGSHSASVQLTVWKYENGGRSEAQFDDIALGVCVDTPFALCLTESRFFVEASFRTAASSSYSNGQSLPMKRDSGLFWFFNAENLEVLVKVLDGCGINARFWVYLAATTDVEYVLKITDTSTGAQKTYSNPLGNLAAARSDVNAFSGCVP